MDLRIVNTCNNNCLYCLESSLRNKEKYISKDFIFAKILEDKKKSNITFFGGNSILHPDILEIISFCYKNGFSGIGLLSNTYGLEKNFFSEMITKGLNTFGIYFNCFDKKNHELVNGGGIDYETYLDNLKIICQSGLNIRVIVHINNLNIITIARDVLILREKYGIKYFDFVNYFPFDKPYENKNILDYNIIENRLLINLLFKVIKKLNLKVNFIKFSLDFFGDYIEFYNYKRGIINQIGEEDKNRLSGDDKPFCLDEKRCKSCFIKDKCKYYGA